MLTELRGCSNIYDVGVLLNIPPKHLSYLLYILPEASRYTKACLSKKNGGTRDIMIPNLRLKILQQRLSHVLYECQREIDESNGPRRSFGFEQGRDIFDNASQHLKRRWVFNIDLADFFPSINFGRVISYFKKNHQFLLEPKVATLLAQIACHENQLPQGAPSSPVISNLIAGNLDYRLSRLARQGRCSFTRYADDITFSTNEKTFPDLIAIKAATEQGWQASPELESRIASAGFTLNSAKTRMSDHRSRQMVTGLVVNKQPNIPRPIYKECRAAVHNMLRAKPWNLPRFHQSYHWNCEDKTSTLDQFAALEGRYAHIYRIRDRADNRTPKQKFFQPTASTRSYADLLFLKYFVNGSRPIILTEGVSDILYLKAALRSSTKDIVGILEHDPIGPNKTLVDFFKFPERNSSLLGLTGGTGGIGIFLERYRDFLKRLSTNVPRRPFLLFVDNDGGLDGIRNVLVSKFKIKIDPASNDDFYKLSDSFYLIKTPHKGHLQKTAAEDFLDPKAVSQTLNGKTFSSAANYDTNKHFGKYILGSHVLANYDKYSFVAFQPILDRLAAALHDV